MILGRNRMVQKCSVLLVTVVAGASLARLTRLKLVGTLAIVLLRSTYIVAPLETPLKSG